MPPSMLRFPLLLVAVLLAWNAATAETVLLTSARPIWAGPEAISNLLGGDFDADGKRDFVIVHPRKSIAFHRGLGNGAFAEPILTPIHYYGGEITAADINGDGKLDLALDAMEIDDLAVLLNDGSGRFVTTALLNTSPDRAGPIAFGDFTGDGKPDLVTQTFASHPGKPAVIVFPGDGQGHMGSAIVTRTVDDIGTYPRTVIPIDIDKDGKLDLVPCMDDSGTAVWMGKGDGTFTLGRPGMRGRSMAVADFNRDGFADFVVTDIYVNYVTVTLGSSAGPRGPSARWRVATDSDRVTTADMNRDGIADIVTLSHSGSRATVLLGRGDGTFIEPARMFLTGPGAYYFDVGDYDGDGAPDVLSVDYNDVGVVSLLRGRGDGVLRGPESFLVRTGVPEKHPDPEARGLRLLDVTGDGKADAITVTEAETGFVLDITVLPGNGDGRFGTPILTPTGVHSSPGGSYIVGDFNHDGRGDVLYSAEQTLRFFAGHGDGTFTRGPSSSEGAGDMIAADFTNDGKLDLFVGSFLRPAIRPGAGDGTFGARIPANVDVHSHIGMAVTDTNRDGNLDVVYSPDFVLLGDGAGGLTRKEQPADAERDYDLLGLADLDEDGIADSVTQDFGERLRIRRGRGDGSYGPADVFALTTEIPGIGRLGSASVQWADMNGDHHLDLVFGTSILLGDGKGSFNGYESFRYRGSPHALAIADVDGNGTPDLVGLAGAGLLDVILTAREPSLDVPVTLTLAASKATTVYDEPITWTATLEAQSPYKRFGAVRFDRDGKPFGIMLVDPLTGTAQLTTPLPVGSHTVTATLLRNDVYAPDSDAVMQNVEKAPPRLTVQPQQNPAVAGRNLTMLIHTAFAVAGSPTGTVTLSIDGAAVQTFTLGADVLRYSTSTLSAGTHTVTATYSGDANFHPATYTYEQRIILPPPAISFRLSPWFDVDVLTPVALTATLRPSNATGTVTFSERGTVLATADVVAGVATVTILLPRGNLVLYAHYSGDTVFGPNSSDPATVYVKGVPRRRSVRP